MNNKMKKQYISQFYPQKQHNKVLTFTSNLFKNPLSQIIIFGIIMMIMQFLGMMGMVETYFMSAIGSTLIYAIVSIGFCFLLGYAGLASLGTGGFIGLGAYLCYYSMIEWGQPYIVALLITLVVSVVIGIVVGFISLRIEGIYLAILTLGLSEIIRNLLIVVKANIKIPLSNLVLFGVRVEKFAIFFIILIIFMVFMWLLFNFINSPTGRAMIAMKNSTSAAQAMGISLMKYRLFAFVVSILFAAVAGLMYMLYIRNINASTSTLLTLSTSLNVLGAVVIGGAKSLWGTTFGAFLIYGLQPMFLSNIPFFQENPAFIVMFTGLLIIVITMFYPLGIAQMVKTIYFKIKLKIKNHRRYKYGTEE